MAIQKGMKIEHILPQTPKKERKKAKDKDLVSANY